MMPAPVMVIALLEVAATGHGTNTIATALLVNGVIGIGGDFSVINLDAKASATVGIALNIGKAIGNGTIIGATALVNVVGMGGIGGEASQGHGNAGFTTVEGLHDHGTADGALAAVGKGTNWGNGEAFGLLHLGAGDKQGQQWSE
jgi:hypothetical protein